MDSNYLQYLIFSWTILYMTEAFYCMYILINKHDKLKNIPVMVSTMGAAVSMLQTNTIMLSNGTGYQFSFSIFCMFALYSSCKLFNMWFKIYIQLAGFHGHGGYEKIELSKFIFVMSSIATVISIIATGFHGMSMVHNLLVSTMFVFVGISAIVLGFSILYIYHQLMKCISDMDTSNYTGVLRKLRLYCITNSVIYTIGGCMCICISVMQFIGFDRYLNILVITCIEPLALCAIGLFIYMSLGIRNSDTVNTRLANVTLD